MGNKTTKMVVVVTGRYRILGRLRNWIDLLSLRVEPLDRRSGRALGPAVQLDGPPLRLEAAVAPHEDLRLLRQLPSATFAAFDGWTFWNGEKEVVVEGW